MILVNGATHEIKSIEAFLEDKLGFYSLRATSWDEDIAALKEFGIRAEFGGPHMIELHFPSEHEETLFRLKYL